VASWFQIYGIPAQEEGKVQLYSLYYALYLSDVARRWNCKLLLGFRVMAFVQKAVARLHEPEKLEALLQELGKKHFTYGVKPKYIDVSRNT
jgi:hypothetical protein